MININLNRILIPVDFSKTSNRAIKQGAFIAKYCKGEIILLHVQKKNELMDIILPALKIKSPTVITDYLQEKLNKLAATVQKECGITVTTLVSVGNITSEIVNIAEETKSDMIIMGTQGADSENDLFLGSNSYRVITKSDIPVMTVRSELAKSGYKHILLPIDSSEHSRQKVNAAIQIANKFSAQLHVVGILGKNEKNYEYKMEVIFNQIQKMAKAKKLVCTTEISVAANRAQKTLAFAKKLNADLIITMTDQTAGASRLIMGTYNHQLINASKIPVLSIPPEINGENIGQDSIGGMW
jgi:nucleotide-binding universal stress UspA family protein